MEQEKATLALHTKKIMLAALEKGYGLAIWRLPHTNEKHVIIDFGGSHTPQRELEELPTGFLFSPYKKEQKYSERLIHADLHIKTIPLLWVK